MARVPPRETPEMVELVKPALSNVPDSVGVKVRAPAVGTIFIPIVSPFLTKVVVEKATAV